MGRIARWAKHLKSLFYPQCLFCFETIGVFLQQLRMYRGVCMSSIRTIHLERPAPNLIVLAYLTCVDLDGPIHLKIHQIKDYEMALQYGLPTGRGDLHTATTKITLNLWLGGMHRLFHLQNMVNLTHLVIQGIVISSYLPTGIPFSRMKLPHLLELSVTSSFKFFIGLLGLLDDLPKLREIHYQAVEIFQGQNIDSTLGAVSQVAPNRSLTLSVVQAKMVVPAYAISQTLSANRKLTVDSNFQDLVRYKYLAHFGLSLFFIDNASKELSERLSAAFLAFKRDEIAQESLHGYIADLKHLIELDTK